MTRSAMEEVGRSLMGEPSVSTLAFLTPFIETARELGFTPDDDALATSERDARSRRIPVDAAVRLICESGEALRMPAFHLHVARHAPLGSFDLVEAVMRNEPTVRALLEAAVRFS